MTANLIADDRDEMRVCLPGIIYQPIDVLKPDPGNARKHSKKQIGQIARSIKHSALLYPYSSMPSVA